MTEPIDRRTSASEPAEKNPLDVIGTCTLCGFPSTLAWGEHPIQPCNDCKRKQLDAQYGPGWEKETGQPARKRRRGKR